MSLGPGLGACPTEPRDEGHAWRGAELFPLPRVGVAELGEMVDLSSVVGGKRGVHRMLQDINDCTRSLNWLSSTEFQAPRRALGRAGRVRLEGARGEVLRRVAGLCEERGPCCRDVTPKEAFQELLRGRGLYQTETAYATLAAYKHGAVSMPEDANSAPRVVDILPDSAQQYLVGLRRRCCGGTPWQWSGS